MATALLTPLVKRLISDPDQTRFFFVTTDRIRGGGGCFVSPIAHAQRLPGFSVRSTLQFRELSFNLNDSRVSGRSFLGPL